MSNGTAPREDKTKSSTKNRHKSLVVLLLIVLEIFSVYFVGFDIVNCPLIRPYCRSVIYLHYSTIKSGECQGVCGEGDWGRECCHLIKNLFLL